MPEALQAPRSRRAQTRNEIRLRAASGVLVGDDARLVRHADDVVAELRRHTAEELLEHWDHERVLALAVHRAGQYGFEHPMLSEMAAEIRRQAVARAGLFELVAIQLLGRLGQHGIEALMLKGSTLAERLYGDAGLRSPSVDADVLVPTDRLFDAAALVESLGWEPPTDPLLANGLPDHHLVMISPTGLPTIELHWRVEWYDGGVHPAGLLERRLPYRGLSVPEPVDVLSILLLCWARDGLHRLRLAADIAAWWRVFGDEYGAATARLWEPGPLARTHTIAAQSAAAIVGTPPPPNPLTDRSARLAVAIATTDRPRTERVADTSQRALVDLLVCPRDRRRERFFSSWAPEPSVSLNSHPWAPRQLVPALRTITAARTAAESVPIVARARRMAAAAGGADGRQAP